MMLKTSVAILLCSYQGELFLEKQLDSIVKQTHTHWKLYISDDGSNDKTLEIVTKYQALWGKDRIKLLHGPKKGFVANFMSLIYNKEINADAFALADQDDIWELDKLERALQHMSATKPSLYCSRTRLIDSDDRPRQLSNYYKKLPCFAHALVQNIASGNTMLFNKQAMTMLRKVPNHVDIILHDWWIYLVITGCGGIVFYDSYPSVLYRQHGKNLIGADPNWIGRLKRIHLLMKGYFAQRTDSNINGLLRIAAFLTLKNKAILNQFRNARKQSFLPRIIGIIRSGVFCQTIPGKIKLVTAVLLKKI